MRILQISVLLLLGGEPLAFTGSGPYLWKVLRNNFDSVSSPSPLL